MPTGYQFCPSCGADIVSAQDRHCRECGVPLEQHQRTESAVAAARSAAQAIPQSAAPAPAAAGGQSRSPWGAVIAVGLAIAGVITVGGIIVQSHRDSSDHASALGAPRASSGEDLVPYDAPQTHQFARTTLYTSTHTLNVEVALSPEERSDIGLKGRSSLAYDSGMLYVEPTTRTLDGQSSWWETDGYVFPIDIVWLDETRRVVGVYENVAPGASHYASPGPVRYVIEMNGLSAKNLGLVEGTYVDWDSWWE